MQRIEFLASAATQEGDKVLYTGGTSELLRGKLMKPETRKAFANGGPGSERVDWWVIGGGWMHR